MYRIGLISSVVLASFICPAVADENDLAKADKQLNAVYKEIEGRLSEDAETKARLTTAQRAWIKFRDSECEFQGSLSIGGTVYPAVIAACRAELTEHRVEALKEFLSCKEGDLSCPVPSGKS